MRYCYFAVSLALSLLLLPMVGTHAQSSCTNQRYLVEQFTLLEQKNVQYGQATAIVYPPYIAETATYQKDLYLDLYLPQNDTLTKRPAIVLVFGGAFLIGLKEQPQLVDFARYMARRGYVVACIDYRLGFNTLNNQSPIRAVYRAAQDLKAAIRYLKYNATSLQIDTNYVFAGGNSAGGITSLHAAYVNETERQNSSLMQPTYSVNNLLSTWPDLGCISCSGNTISGVSDVPDLVINLWGAIGDTTWIQSAGDAPVISIHGTDDPIVLPGAGSPFNYPAFPALYGSIPIHQRAQHLGMRNQLHLFQGAGHEVWFDGADALLIQQYVADFMYNFLKPTTPTISGNTTPCGGIYETYTVPYHAGSTYCWQVSGGGQIMGSTTGNTISVFWPNTALGGTITVREISRNVVESDPAQLSVTITPLTPPANLTPSSITPNSVTLTWTAPVGVAQFEVAYRIVGNSGWTTLSTNTNQVILNNLSACRNYEVKVRSLCGAFSGNYSNIQTITTECIRVYTNIWLEGAYSAGQMSTFLRDNNLLPTTQPYNRQPWNYAGSESINLSNSAFDDASDWVLVELRNANNPYFIEGRAAAILRNDGVLIDPIDGQIGVAMRQLSTIGNYFIAIRHRNHHSIMSANYLSVPNTGAPYNFTNAANKAMGNGQQKQLSANTFALFAGDFNHDGIINYSDYNTQRQMPYFSQQYNDADANFNGAKDTPDLDVLFPNAKVIGILQFR